MYLKRIPMDGPQNFRDLGGFMTEEGRAVSWNRLYRADGLNRLSEADVRRLRELNVRTIVDLRGVSEQEAYPDVVPEGADYRSCPMMREEISGTGELAGHSFARSLLTGYQTMVNEDRELIGQAFRAVAGGLEKGAVVFHCTAGKDRTGILAAVILLLLGVYEEDIIADYQVSYTYNEKGINRMVESVPELKEFLENSGEDSMLHSNPKNIRGVIDILRGEGIENWLEEAGVSCETAARLRELMLEA